MGMTDTLLQFQILICTSTFTSLKRSIFSASFSATRVSKGQSYTDNEAQPSLLFQNYDISSIIIITIIIIVFI